MTRTSSDKPHTLPRAASLALPPSRDASLAQSHAAISTAARPRRFLPRRPCSLDSRTPPSGPSPLRRPSPRRRPRTRVHAHAHASLAPRCHAPAGLPMGLNGASAATDAPANPTTPRRSSPLPTSSRTTRGARTRTSCDKPRSLFLVLLFALSPSPVLPLSCCLSPVRPTLLSQTGANS